MVTAEIKGNNLIITLPLQDPTPSGSGKSLTVASTRGNLKTTATVGGKPITIGVNAYISLKQPRANCRAIPPTCPCTSAADSILYAAIPTLYLRPFDRCLKRAEKAQESARPAHGRADSHSSRFQPCQDCARRRRRCLRFSRPWRATCGRPRRLCRFLQRPRLRLSRLARRMGRLAENT